MITARAASVLRAMLTRFTIREFSGGGRIGTITDRHRNWTYRRSRLYIDGQSIAPPAALEFRGRTKRERRMRCFVTDAFKSAVAMALRMRKSAGASEMRQRRRPCQS